MRSSVHALGKPTIGEAELSGSCRVTTCTSYRFRLQGKSMLPVKSTVSDSSQPCPANILTLNNYKYHSLLSFTVLWNQGLNIKKPWWVMWFLLWLIMKLANVCAQLGSLQTWVIPDHHLSNACWDCFKNFGVEHPRHVVQVVVREMWRVHGGVVGGGRGSGFDSWQQGTAQRDKQSSHFVSPR